MKTGNIYCIKDGLQVACRPEKRKQDSMLPKWWCFNCKRYVLPDNKYHKYFIIIANKKETGKIGGKQMATAPDSTCIEFSEEEKLELDTEFKNFFWEHCRIG